MENNSKKFEMINELYEAFNGCEVKEITIYENGFACATILSNDMEIYVRIKDKEEEN